MNKGYVLTGRSVGGKEGQPKRLCQACRAQITYGQPNPNGIWLPRLSLTREQINLLLLAAAEFDAAAEEYDDHDATAVEFIDWISVDVLREGAA